MGLNEINKEMNDVIEKELFASLVKRHPDLKLGKVECLTCERIEYVDTEKSLKEGWPKCCGYTMNLVAISKPQ